MSEKLILRSDKECKFYGIFLVSFIFDKIFPYMEVWRNYECIILQVKHKNKQSGNEIRILIENFGPMVLKIRKKDAGKPDK